jgi:hypothetical protein
MTWWGRCSSRLPAPSRRGRPPGKPWWRPGWRGSPRRPARASPRARADRRRARRRRGWFTEPSTTGAPPRTRRASPSITPRSAPTSGARSPLLTTSSSERVTTGPPLRAPCPRPPRRPRRWRRRPARARRRPPGCRPRLHEHELEGPVVALEPLDGVGVHGHVVAEGRVRAASRLHAHDALRGQHPGPDEEVGVLAGVDVVRDGRDLEPVRGAGRARPRAPSCPSPRALRPRCARRSRDEKAHGLALVGHAVEVEERREGVEVVGGPLQAVADGRSTAGARERSVRWASPPPRGTSFWPASTRAAALPCA